MTIKEVYQQYEGWEYEYNNSWRQAAFVAANIMNMQSQKHITVDSLLGIKKTAKKKTKEEILADKKYLDEVFKKKA